MMPASRSKPLGLSVFLRLQEINGKTVDFPEDCYQGDYIRDIAAELKAEKGDRMDFCQPG